jgi:hypothetical protein
MWLNVAAPAGSLDPAINKTLPIVAARSRINNIIKTNSYLIYGDLNRAAVPTVRKNAQKRCADGKIDGTGR